MWDSRRNAAIEAGPAVRGALRVATRDTVRAASPSVGYMLSCGGPPTHRRGSSEMRSSGASGAAAQPRLLACTLCPCIQLLASELNAVRPCDVQR
jgi:hypothetical protein